MKIFSYLFIPTALFIFFSCENEPLSIPIPVAEAHENGSLFPYITTAGFKDREFYIKLFSQDAKYHSVDIFLEDFKEGTYFFGINTFSEVRIANFYSSDIEKSNTGYLTIEKINWQDSTFDAVFEFEIRERKYRNIAGKWDNGRFQNIPFSNLGGEDKKLCRLSMKIDGEQYAFRCPSCHWKTYDSSSMIINPLSFMSGHVFFFATESLDLGRHDLKDLNRCNVNFVFPDDPNSQGHPENFEGNIHIQKNELNDFEASFDFEVEYLFNEYQLSDGKIIIQ